MNKFILIATSLLAISQAATVVPTDSSSVNVKQSGKEYSYSIQQSHGIAIGPSHANHQVPIVKSAQLSTSAGGGILEELPQPQQGHIQGQIHQNQIQTRLSDDIQKEDNKLQEQVTVVQYPILPGKPIHSNFFYILPYPYDFQYPQNFIRYI